MQPHRRQPTRLPSPWDSPGKNTGVGCHFLLQCMKVKRESEVAQSCLTLSDPMDYSLPGSSVHGIFQQEYWSGLPLPSPLKMLWFLNVITSQSEAHASQVCRHICSIYQWHWIRHFLKPSWRYSESYCISHVFNFCILRLFDIWGLY